MLILKDRGNAFDDNWIYIHDPSVKVGRIQNFRSWSPEMVPDPDKACYGLEYFCFETRRPVEVNRRRTDRIGYARADPDRPGRRRATCSMAGRSAEEGISRLRRRLCASCRSHSAGIGRSLSELASCRPQRHAQIQQSGPRHDDRDALRGKYSGRPKTLRSLEVNSDAEYHEAGAAGAQEATGTALRLVPKRVATEPELVRKG